jgi:hypothetical protein
MPPAGRLIHVRRATIVVTVPSGLARKSARRVITYTGIPIRCASATSWRDGSGSASGCVCATATAFAGIGPRYVAARRCIVGGQSTWARRPSSVRTTNAPRSVS